MKSTILSILVLLTIGLTFCDAAGLGLISGVYRDSRHGGELSLCSTGSTTYEGFYSNIGLIAGEYDADAGIFSGNWIEAGAEDNTGTFFLRYYDQHLVGHYFDDGDGQFHAWELTLIHLTLANGREDCFEFEEDDVGDGSLRGSFINWFRIVETESEGEDEEDDSPEPGSVENEITAEWDACFPEDLDEDDEDDEDSPDAAESGEWDITGSAEFADNQRSFFFYGDLSTDGRTLTANYWRGDAGAETITEGIMIARLLSNSTFSAYLWVGGQDPEERRNLFVGYNSFYYLSMDRPSFAGEDPEDDEPVDCERNERLVSGDFSFTDVTFDRGTSSATTVVVTWALGLFTLLLAVLF